MLLGALSQDSWTEQCCPLWRQGQELAPGGGCAVIVLSSASPNILAAKHSDGQRNFHPNTAAGQLNATSQPERGLIMGNIWGEMGIPHSPVIPWTILGQLLHKMDLQSSPEPQLCN